MLNTLSYDVSFSSAYKPDWGAQQYITFMIVVPTRKRNWKQQKLYLFTEITLLTHFSANIIPSPPTPNWSQHQKNLQMVFFPLISRADPPLHLVSCKQQRSTFRRVSSSAISLALSLIVPTFIVHKQIQCFPTGLPTWLEVGCTNNSSIFDTALFSIEA